MRKFLSILLVASLPLLAAPSVAAQRQPGDATPAAVDNDRFELYRAVVDRATAEELRQDYDHDVLTSEPLSEAAPAGKVVVDVILSGVAAQKLRAEGVNVQLRRNDKGQTFTEAANARIAAGQTVYRSYSEPGGIEDELRRTARRHPRITKLVRMGRSLQGQPILALKVTKNARRVPNGKRPAALYQGPQHAREWISPEVTRRLMHHFIAAYGRNARMRRLMSHNEFWFAPVVNPDGYDYTFTEDNRLWRKNLRDNDGDGQISASADGVDLNRNFASNWGYDDEGSSPVPSSQVYRGTRPASEPETRAQNRLMRRIGFNFLVNTTRPPSCCCTGSAGRSTPRRRTTSSTRRWPATTRSPPSRASTRTCPPSCTPPTARPSTTPRPGMGSWASRRSSANAKRSPTQTPVTASSTSPTTRR